MTLRFVLASALLGVTYASAQAPSPPDAEADTVAAQNDGDAYLVRSVRAVGERIAAIIHLGRTPSVGAVRADESTRSDEVLARAQRLLPNGHAEARGRAWRDLGFGSGNEPQDLVIALERDLPGMTFDPTRGRLLVDPERLLPDSGHGDPAVDPDATVLLATGVAPDEPIAGHYMAHAFLDGPALEGPATTDALLARKALAEGSANLAALMLLFGGVGLESDVVSGSLRPEEVMGGRMVPESLRSASPVVTHLLEFVYLDGFAQAAALARKGGFARLSQERKTRRSTRDVLHLDRPPGVPLEMAEPSLPTALGLSVADRDTLGEQGIVSLVSILTGKDNLGLIAGDGWGADVLWRFEPGPGSGAKSGDGATIWMTRWGTEEDAGDFAYGLERCLKARFPGESLEADPQRGGQVLRRPDRIYRIERSGVEVAFRVLTPTIDGKSTPPPKKKGPPPRPLTPKKQK